MLYNSNYMTFQKRQICRDSKTQIARGLWVGWPGEWEGDKAEHREL